MLSPCSRRKAAAACVERRVQTPHPVEPPSGGLRGVWGRRKAAAACVEWRVKSKPHTPRSRRRAGADEGCVIGWFLDAADKHRHQVL